MPVLEPSAALEVSAIHSVAGTIRPDRPLVAEPPFCAPHHTATKAAIVGGGSGIIRPGAASLAHHGCLFLDEAPEFGRDVLDALRQPLESGEVVIARSGLTARFPARFTLVLAANPCPCARTTATGSGCTCTPLVRRRYLARLSGPLLDRVDVKVELLPVGRAELLSDRQLAEPSAVVAARVAEARLRAAPPAGGHPVAAERRDPGKRAAPVLPARPRRAGSAGTGHGPGPGQRAGGRPDHPDVVDAGRPGGRGTARCRPDRHRTRPVARNRTVRHGRRTPSRLRVPAGRSPAVPGICSLVLSCGRLSPASQHPTSPGNRSRP